MWYEFKQSILNKACIQKYMETHTKTHRGTLGWVLKVQLVFQIVSWTPFSAPDLLITMLHLAPNIKAFRHMNLCESWLHTYQNCFFFLTKCHFNGATCLVGSSYGYLTISLVWTQLSTQLISLPHGNLHRFSFQFLLWEFHLCAIITINK